jgi:diacylglycerol kinase (ATP)
MAESQHQATIIYNRNARQASTMPLEEIEAGLAELGYAPRHLPTDDVDDLDAALSDTRGLVLAVGGDGTLHAVALRLAGRKDAQLAFLSAGTANNFAKSMGIDMPWKDALAGLAQPRELTLDLGRMRGPLGEELFLEAFGCGLYADALAEYDPDQGKSKLRAVSAMTNVLPGFAPYEWQLTIDGAKVEGRFLLLEALNISLVGPNLNLAPDADPFDGLLDVVTIFEDKKVGLLEHVRKMQAGELSQLDNVEVRRAKKIEIVWTGFPVHLDDTPKFELHGDEEGTKPRSVSPELQDEKPAVIVVDVLPGAVNLLLPPAKEAQP